MSPPSYCLQDSALRSLSPFGCIASSFGLASYSLRPRRGFCYMSDPFLSRSFADPLRLLVSTSFKFSYLTGFVRDSFLVNHNSLRRVDASAGSDRNYNDR